MASTAKKAIWLIKVPEPTPLDGGSVRLFRSGLLAERLAAAGHSVTWWNTTVNHQKKAQRFHRHTNVTVSENLTITFLHAPLYRKDVGAARLYNLYATSRAFRKLARRAAPPDIILCALPPLELSREAVLYGTQRGIPVIIDVQDLWPDAFLKFAPPRLRPAMKLLLFFWFRAVRTACRKATAVTGTTDAFVDWALTYAGRNRRALDRSFPLAYAGKKPEETAREEARRRWNDLGIGTDPEQFVCCFFGYLGKHYEIDVVIEAARKLQDSPRKFVFVLCGASDNLAQYRQITSSCRNVFVPGWVGEADIHALMEMSSAGLAPYKKTFTLCKNLTNKPIEYWSAGLPVVSSLEGVLADIIARHNCGITYRCGSADELAAALVRLHDNPAERSTMSENALRLFRQNYTAEKVYADMASYLLEIANRRNTAEPS